MMSKHTPGPWGWEVNEKSKQIELCGGNPPYDLTVIYFVRYGMGGAAPRFREDKDNLNIMHRAEKYAVPAGGREHHANWFKLLDHPDAHLIAAAPELLQACQEIHHEMCGKCKFYGDCDPDEQCDERNQLAAAIAKAKGES